MKIDWDEVVEDLGPRLYRYFRVSFNVERADDLVQEVLLRLVRKVENDEFDPVKGSLQKFAFGIAHYVRLENFKTAEWAEEIETADGQPSSEDLIEKKRASHHVRQAVAELPQVQRDIVHLTIDEHLSMKDIGVLLNIPLNTVKSHIHRAKLILKQKVAFLKEEQ